MENKKKLKFFKILILIVVIMSALYCAAWGLYYKFTITPHITEDMTLENDDGTCFNRYSAGNDENYNSYTLYVPRFGKFVFYCCVNSSIDLKDGEQKNMSGSPFDYSMVAEFDLFGNVKSYKFNVEPMPPQEKYAVSTLCILDSNGNLQNEGDMSQSELAIYNDSKDELLDYISRVNERFQIE